VVMSSSRTGDGLDKAGGEIRRFRSSMTRSDQNKRSVDNKHGYWMWKSLQDPSLAQAKTNSRLGQEALALERDLRDGKTTPCLAAAELLDSLVRS
jgi:putative protein kinase ArgK-like GTPase of G3E family